MNLDGGSASRHNSQGIFFAREIALPDGKRVAVLAAVELRGQHLRVANRNSCQARSPATCRSAGRKTGRVC